ncbi:hypothetical protein SNARM312S_01752 [Streptomyces narbonensis]
MPTRVRSQTAARARVGPRPTVTKVAEVKVSESKGDPVREGGGGAVREAGAVGDRGVAADGGSVRARRGGCGCSFVEDPSAL